MYQTKGHNSINRSHEPKHQNTHLMDITVHKRIYLQAEKCNVYRTHNG